LINDLRNGKGHKKSAQETLARHGLDKTRPRQVYFAMLVQLCEFLRAFRVVTGKAFGTRVSEQTVDSANDSWSQAEDPWFQVDRAEEYFRSRIA
jgi:hypothetical protein